MKADKGGAWRAACLMATPFAVLVLTSPTHANSGAPLLAYPLLWTMLLLVPIIGVEAYILKDQLHLRVWRALRVASAANVLSTLAGFIMVILSAQPPLADRRN